MAELGVWMPPSLLTEESRRQQGAIAPNEAFAFWADVFGWVNPAQARRAKEQRLRKVYAMASALRRDETLHKQVVVIDRGYYMENKDVCFAFFRALQKRVEERGIKWEVVCYGPQMRLKGFHW